MADTKLTALAAGTPTPDDLIYFVDDPLGVPTSKKALVGLVIPTSVLGKILISQGIGVPSILSDTPLVATLWAGSIGAGAFISGTAFGLAGVSIITRDVATGVLNLSTNDGMVAFPERTLSSLITPTGVGTLANISDSTTNVIGSIVTGGGANHILARWNGSNWIVISGTGGSSSIAIGSTPITGGVADRALAHSVAGDNVVEIVFTGTGNVVRSASPTFTGTATFASMILGSLNTFTIATRFLLASSAASQARFANTGDSTGVVLDFATDGILKIMNRTGVSIADLQARSLASIPNTVANLPATPVAGMRAGVTDATVTLTAGIGTTVVGGGSNKVPVYFDGTNWLVG